MRRREAVEANWNTRVSVCSSLSSPFALLCSRSQMKMKWKWKSQMNHKIIFCRILFCCLLLLLFITFFYHCTAAHFSRCVLSQVKREFVFYFLVSFHRAHRSLAISHNFYKWNIWANLTYEPNDGFFWRNECGGGCCCFTVTLRVPMLMLLSAERTSDFTQLTTMSKRNWI